MKTLFLVRRGGGLQVRRLIQFQTKFFALELWGRQFEVGVPAGILILDTLERSHAYLQNRWDLDIALHRYLGRDPHSLKSDHDLHTLWRKLQSGFEQYMDLLSKYLLLCGEEASIAGMRIS